MLNKLTAGDKVFILHCVLFVLVVTGILPRSIVPFWTLALIAYILAAREPDGAVFFVRTIPLFIAIPISESFDSLNMWRVVVLALFAKWFLTADILPRARALWHGLLHMPRQFIRTQSVLVGLGGLALLAGLSLTKAADLTAGITRIIYFVNLSLIGIILYDLLMRRQLGARQLISAIALPTMIAVAVGYLQLAATYVMDIYQFMQIWGEGIQLRQFGTLWSTIAVWMGNTWFAYYGPQLSLRVFSLFPDSHSFPTFLLLGLPALMVAGIRNIAADGALLNSLKRMYRTRAKLAIVWVPALFLIAILSGTRGIWAASIGVLPLAVILAWLMRRKGAAAPRRNLFKYGATYFVAFFLLFAVAYPIFVSPQFLLSKGDWGLLADRIRSIIDFGETSNSQRIEIWRQTLDSIGRHPLLGVGIGNFPTVLDQRVFLARAGSTAHNIYLHVAAEMGLGALILTLWFMWKIFAGAYRMLVRTGDPFLAVYAGSAVLTIPWVYAYLLTDAALFDERAFLLFAVTAALILATQNESTTRNDNTGRP